MRSDIIIPQKPEDNTPRQSSAQPSSASPMIAVAILLAGLIIAGSVFFSNRKTTTPTTVSNDATSPTSANTEYADPRAVSDDDHILGSPSAKIFVIEYSDLECEYCKEFHPIMHKILDEFGKTGDVAWIYRQMPIKQLHSQAPAESEAAECAGVLGGNTTFWSFIDKVFEITPSGNGLDLAKLPEIANGLGLDVDSFNACVNSGQTLERINRDISDALASGASGTPFVYIVSKNDKMTLAGGQSYLAMKIIINNMLAKE